MRTVIVLLMAVVLAACSGASAGATPSADAGAASGASPSAGPTASLAGPTVPLPPIQGGPTSQGAQFAALANAMNASMAAIPEPERTLEQVTAAYGMQAAIMERFTDGLMKIDWQPLVHADAWRFVTLALRVEFWDAALSRAPSMTVVESLESSRETATADWQAAVDALSRGLGVGPMDGGSPVPK